MSTRTNWNTATADKLDDDTGTSYVVFNLGENGLSGNKLSSGDLLIAWQMTDDQGTKRWVGHSLYALWKAVT